MLRLALALALVLAGAQARAQEDAGAAPPDGGVGDAAPPPADGGTPLMPDGGAAPPLGTFPQNSATPSAPPEPSTPGSATPPTATPHPGAAAVDEAAIARALAADQAAHKQATAQSATAAPGSGSEHGFAGALSRAFQSLNPDISAIVDFTGGYYSDDQGTIKSGDDPAHTGFNAQEIELAFQAVVDPYFRADVYLTIPNLEGVEVEEAYLTTTSLPANLQLRVGVFRAALGRQNTQHLHLQYFTRRPELNAALIGTDGLHSPGMELNWLVPRIPFYLLLSASAFSVAPAEADQPLQTFGGGQPWDLAYVGSAKFFFPLNEATSLYAGLNYARGKTSQRVSANTALPSTAEGLTIYDNYYDNLYAADLYLKWKPPNQARSYTSVMWQSEYFLRQIPELVLGGQKRPQLEGGLYSQVVIQLLRRWYLGLRGEVMGIPSGDNVKREYAGAASLTWGLSEFSRIRVYGELRYGPRFLPLDTTPHPDRLAGAAFLQFEAAIGAHGAHPF